MLTPDDVDFLDRQRVGHLATVNAEGQPHVVPVCYARVGAWLYVPVDAKPKRGNPRSLKRLRNLRERPDAMLLVDHYAEDWQRLRWLQVRARASILESGAERVAAFDALERRYPQYQDMGLAGLELPVIALEPTSVRRWTAAGTAGDVQGATRRPE